MAEIKDIAQARLEQRKKRRRRKVRSFLLLLLVLAVLGGGIYAFIHFDAALFLQEKLDFSSQQFPVTLNAGVPHSLHGIGNSVGVLTDTSFMVLRASGSELVSLQHNFTNPAVASSGNRFLVYDRGGTGLYAYNSSKQLAFLTSEYPIISAAVADNGVIAVATTSERYIAQLTVYSEEGAFIWEWLSSDLHILDVTISEDGRHLAVSCVTSEGGELVSYLLFFQTDSTEELNRVAFPSTLLLSVEYQNDGSLFVIGDNLYALLSAQGEVRNKTDFSKRHVSAFWKSGNGAVIVTQEFSNSNRSELMILDASASQTGQISLETRINGLYLDEQYLMVFLESGCEIYDRQASPVVSLSLEEETVAALLKNGALYLLKAGSIEKQEIGA